MTTNKILWMLAVCGFLCVTASQAQAPDVLDPPIKTTKKKSKKSRGGAKATFTSGSQETKQERSTRLKRECKDGVDAGACTGYTK
ncbi:MAG: hypothetical protein ACK5A0_06755 [Polaromonas sp.]|jgi:hypothetical protein